MLWKKAFGEARKDNPDVDRQKTLVNETAQIGDVLQKGAGLQTDNTANALDYIRSRLHNCWIVDTGAVDYQDLIVDVRLLFEQRRKHTKYLRFLTMHKSSRHQTKRGQWHAVTLWQLFGNVHHMMGLLTIELWCMERP